MQQRYCWLKDAPCDPDCVAFDNGRCSILNDYRRLARTSEEILRELRKLREVLDNIYRISSFRR